MIYSYRLFLFFSVLLCFASCQQESKKDQIEKANHIALLALQASDVLVIDDQIIQQRIDSIEYRNQLIHKKFDAINEEIYNALIVCEGIRNNYKKFLSIYPALQFDNEALIRKTQAFHKKVLKSSQKASDFIAESGKLQREVEINLHTSENAVRSIRQSENEYIRKSDILNQALKSAHK